MILIADDDSDFAENCSMMLQSHGYEVRVAMSGAETLAKISEQAPELLISDCRIGDFGGVQLSEKIRAIPAVGRFPILLMSGFLRCRIAPGATYDAFLRKPFLAEELLNAVSELVGGPAPRRMADSEAP